MNDSETNDVLGGIVFAILQTFLIVYHGQCFGFTYHHSLAKNTVLTKQRLLLR